MINQLYKDYNSVSLKMTDREAKLLEHIILLCDL